MHAYVYRAPRFRTSLAVAFCTASGILPGTILDVSEHGMRVAFREPVLPRTTGQVRFDIDHCSLALEAQVNHSEGFTAGLAFAFASEAERSFVRAILQELQGGAKGRGAESR